MGIREKLGLSSDEPLSIAWDITPADTFGIFESWGGKIHVRSNKERYYYFYIDGWKTPPQLLLMERGVKHARILARIDAPQDMVDACVAGQGRGETDRSYAIDDALRSWLQANVIEAHDTSKVLPLESELVEEPLETGLPGKDEPQPAIEPVTLRSEPAVISEDEVPDIIRRNGFYDSYHNASGDFANHLVDNGDGLTVTDLKTGIQWQRGGCDIAAMPSIQRYVVALNEHSFARFNDWRLPTMEEALSLMEPAPSGNGLHLHPCFSKLQPFIILADQRKSGGYWFVDYKQATVFWGSGIRGAFGRVCRSL
ncbi:MAG: DUF1566 domain-containing protein [Desulfovibrionales bacterium]|nr:DUF1566 domain-containing protein [Desulfovibrionales bacterium]